MFPLDPAVTSVIKTPVRTQPAHGFPQTFEVFHHFLSCDDVKFFDDLDNVE